MVRLIALRSLILLSGLVSLALGDRLSAKHCEDLGFTGLALCSDCNTFAEYVKDEELVSDCRKCCSEDSDNSLSKVSKYGQSLQYYIAGVQKSLPRFSFGGVVLLGAYVVGLILFLIEATFSGAILEVCMRKLGFYPEIVAFIEEDKDEFAYVKVQYAFASPPKLVMLDSDGHHKETIRIDNWKRDHIRQFLKEKVKPSVAFS